MPLKPQRNGRIWRQQIAKARADVRKQRRLITDIVETGPDRAMLYQILVAISLLAGQIDDVLESLDTDFRETESQ